MLGGNIINPQCDKLANLINSCCRLHNAQSICGVDIGSVVFADLDAIAKTLHYMTNFARHIIVCDDVSRYLWRIINFNDYDPFQFVVVECVDWVVFDSVRVLQFVGLEGPLHG